MTETLSDDLGWLKRSRFGVDQSQEQNFLSRAEVFSHTRFFKDMPFVLMWLSGGFDGETLRGQVKQEVDDPGEGDIPMVWSGPVAPASMEYNSVRRKVPHRVFQGFESRLHQ